MEAELTRRPLYKMFNEVPQRYDLLNRFLTWRFDEIWRKKAAKKCIDNKPVKVLDLCTGTGDLAVRIAKLVNSKTEITGLDFSQPMLDVAKTKAEKASVEVQFILGDAANLPFPDNHFDSIGIAFAFRNLTFHNPHMKKYLSEILRTLKKGKTFVIVETGQPQSRLVRALFHFYLKVMVSKAGGLISGHKGAYKYLAHSAINYFNNEELKSLLLDAGFSSIKHQNLLGGIAAIYVAIK